MSRDRAAPPFPLARQEDALREIRRCAGTQFNPSAVEALEMEVNRESQRTMPRDEESESVLALKPALM